MKEKIFNIAKYIIFVTAILQLAISQIHIDVITKVFEPSVGFSLFLFTIFSVLMAFNSSSYQYGQRTLLVIAGCAAAVVSGGVYLNVVFSDIATETLITFVDAKQSITAVCITLGIYLIFTPVMIVSGYLNEKK